MEVRQAKSKDISEIVKIHINRFPTFFLSTLGSGFLKVFYEAFLKYPGVLLVLEDENEIKGFAAGSRDNRDFFKKLVKSNFLNFFLVGLKIGLSNPSALIRLATNASKSREVPLAFAELLSIATVKNKKAYGKFLLESFEKEISSQNSLNLPISLTTDYDDNKKAIDFYTSANYQIHQIFESYQGRKMYRFIKNIN